MKLAASTGLSRVQCGRSCGGNSRMPKKMCVCVCVCVCVCTDRYEFSKLRKFLCVVRFQMEDTLRFLIEESIAKFHAFITQVCAYKVRYTHTHTHT